MGSKPFSRRHQTNAAHLERRADYLANRGKAARKRRADERAARAALLKPKIDPSVERPRFPKSNAPCRPALLAVGSK